MTQLVLSEFRFDWARFLTQANIPFDSNNRMNATLNIMKR
jgi:hypothetical protein